MERSDTRRNATLWMGDLEPYMDDNFLVHAFKEALERPDNVVKNIKFPVHKFTGLQMGYGFVEFIDHNIAFKALHRLGGKIIPNSNPPRRFKLNVVGERGNTPYHSLNEWSVWVGDLDVMVDDSMLYKYFHDKYPSTTAAKVVCDKFTGLSRGFAFVRFSDETEQQKSMIELNNTELEGKRIRIKTAKPQENRQYHNHYGNHYSQTYSDSSYDSLINQGQWYKPYTRYGHGQTEHSEFDDQDALVEPVLIDESETINKDFVNMSGEVYESLESSRWFGAIHPVKLSENSLSTHFVR